MLIWFRRETAGSFFIFHLFIWRKFFDIILINKHFGKAEPDLEKTLVHLHIRGLDRETLFPLLAEFGDLGIVSVAGEFVDLVTESETEIEEINRLREKMVEELYLDFTAFIEPVSPNFDYAPIKEILPKLSPGVYTVTKIIPPVVLYGYVKAKQYLKDYYYGLLGVETIDTAIGFAEAGLNATKASKSMYLHRNTLNYRLDHIARVSGIDVRTFAGAYAMYLLYKS